MWRGGRHCERVAPGCGKLRSALALSAFLTGAAAGCAWTTTTATTTTSATSATPPSGYRAAAAASPPVRISIPAINLHAHLEPVRRAADGTLATPVDWSDAGWYADGVVPGAQGPAVIVGHLDSATTGPAAFFRLPDLRVGDEIFVDNSTGKTSRFVVDTSSQVAKAGFPTAAVYGPTALAELRLITCTGAFDTTTRNYVDNLVVSATAA